MGYADYVLFQFSLAVRESLSFLGHVSFGDFKVTKTSWPFSTLTSLGQHFRIGPSGTR